IDEYREKKFRALAQIAGVIARVSSTESKALDDGVKTNRTRQLIVGLGEAGLAKASERFLDRLKSILSAGGRQVKTDSWHDPRLIIVHDVELPVPLYYLDAVTGEIEDAYLHLAADERRSYHLHTDFKWEKSLPNLNPRRSEITVGWALQVLADGLLTRVIARMQGQGVWAWRRDKDERSEVLGTSLAGSLYRLGEIHRLESLQQRLDKDLRDAHQAMDSPTELARREKLLQLFDGLLEEMDRRQLRGETSLEDVLDRPILRALQIELQKQTDWLPKASSKEDEIYRRFNLDS
ncbi:MAG: hypothetical protein JOZ54_01140, partial [Acidobacteria bacterium]|nr:hypothetical protein [Acidobacteriota bacterium]